MNAELKQFLRNFPVYHEWEPAIDNLVNIDSINVKHAIWIEKSTKIVEVFLIVHVVKTADLDATFDLVLPVAQDDAVFTPATAAVLIMGGQPNGSYHPVTNKVSLLVPDTLSSIPVDAEVCFGLIMVRV